MTKYIENRIKKIKELSEQLNIVNQRIDSYALRLKIILSNYSNVYQLIYNNFNNIKEDSSLFYKKIAISFYHNYKHNSFCFEKKEFDFESKNLSFGIVSTLDHCIELMDQEFGLTTISKDIIESESIYFQIKTLYFEIHKKSSDFKIYADSFLLQIKTFNKSFQINEKFLTHKKSSFLPRRDNKLEKMTFSNSIEDKNLCLNFISPKLENVFNIYNNNHKRVQIFDKQQFYFYFKTEFFNINHEILSFFDIQFTDIQINVTFANQYVCNLNFHLYKENFDYNIYIKDFSKYKLKILHEKFQSIKQLENF